MDQQSRTNRDEAIREKYGKKKAAFIQRNLTDGHMDVIDGTKGMGIEDYLPNAITEWICRQHPDILPLFEGDKFHYRDETHQRRSVIPWLETAAYLLGEKLHRKPEWAEVIDHIKKTDNGVRHRIWYAGRFPDKVNMPDKLLEFFKNEEYLRG